MSEQSLIQNAVQGFFEAVDQRDWAQAESLMQTPFHLDYSSYGAGPAADLSPRAILDGWKAVLPGYDVTHHQLGPLLIEATGKKAKVRAYVTAFHLLEDAKDGPLWTVVGSYEALMDQTEGVWRLEGLTFHYKFQDGNKDLPQMAQARAALSASAEH